MSQNNSNTWERDTIDKLLFSTMVEQRRKRRWGIFFKLTFFAYIVGFSFWLYMADNLNVAAKVSSNHVAVLDLAGVISSDSDANAIDFNKGLEKAFSNAHAKAIILRINSPGGSPVQAHQIYDRIILLRAKHPNCKVYAVINDIGTSAAYLIASAADQIYANKSSIVGSIGVVLPTFGFTGLLEKVGVERRLYTAGKYKALFDPFTAESPESKQIMQTYLTSMHQHFISAVKQGRGARLKIDQNTFSGLFWTGEQAITFGLIDGFADTQHVAREIIKISKTIEYATSSSLIERVAKKVGASTINFLHKVW